MIFFAIMDIERTMQFILDSQAAAEVRMDRADARFEREKAQWETRMARSEARIEQMEKRHDRRMAATTKLIQHGMKSIAELTEAQKVTERTLKNFIERSRPGRNGRNGDE